MATNAVINGFRADTELLLKRYVKQNSTKFECFCTEWNRMNFQYVFCGYMCLSEMVQFLEDAFIVLKRTLLNATSHFEKIGAIYLMYTMYFKQPPKQYCKFRMTMNEWMKMNQFYNEVCIFHAQASLVFWKLIQKDAFRFVEAEYEYGFERFMQKGMSKANDDSKFRKFNPVIESTISSMKDKATGIIPALEILQVGYNEMKEHLDQTSSTLTHSAANSPLVKTTIWKQATSISTEILKGLGTIEKLFSGDININGEEDDDSSDNALTSQVNTTRKQLKKKAFENGAAGSSSKKKVSMKYRTSITDDGEFINIAKSTQPKTRRPNQLNERQIKTVVKQLDLPLEQELELAPKASTSRKIKKEKPGE